MTKLKTWSNSGSDVLTHDPTRPGPTKMADPSGRLHLWFALRYISDKCDLPEGCKIQDYIVQENFDYKMVNIH